MTGPRLLALAAVATLAVGLVAAGPAGAESPVRLEASLGGTPAADGTEHHPVALDPDEPLEVEVRVSNDGGDDVTVGTLRLEGRVMGLTFFAYDTRVGIEVPAHGTETRRYMLDLVGLEGQATGLIPARVVALDAERHTVATQDTVVDVRGSVRSVYGAFGLAVAAFTALALAGALLALARHRLSPNRWRRGVRFCWSGIGIGLLLVFTLSALRVFVPEPHRWAPMVGLSTVALFVLGYLTPTPDEPGERPPDGDEADDEDEHDRAAVPVAAAREPGA